MAKYLTSNETIGELVRTAETNFISGGGAVKSKYVTEDFYEDINKIYAYINSKHISGETDSMDREKPFFNIVLAARNIYYRATDIDRANIGFTAKNSKQVVSELFATAYLQEWMRKENFGLFLNDWGMELATFNSCVVKFVESKGELHRMVIPWSRLIVDPINFVSNPKIEILELTEAELYQRIETHGYDAEIVEKLCDALEARELTDHTKQDQKSNYIKLYEVHLNDKLSLLTGKDSDDKKYQQQMHVITFVARKEEGKFDDFTLVSGKEEKDPYMLTSLLPEADGSISLNGSVKNLFQAQWMLNHTVKSIKDQLDLASKLIFQTADKTFAGKNALSAIQTGDIMVHEINMPLTQVNNQSHDISSQESFGNMWKSLSSEINGVSESMLGQVAPSGTAWRQVEALLNESHSLFELMTENKGLHLENMIREYVIPFIMKKANNADEILATLDEHNITKIDAMYIPAEATNRYNRDTINKIIPEDGSTPTDMYLPTYPEVQSEYESQVKKDLSRFGNRRPLAPGGLGMETWKAILEQMDDLEINITGESSNKQAVLTTLSTALQAVSNPNYANNPSAQLIVAKIMSATGQISPIEIQQLPKPAPVRAPVGGPPGGLPISQ